MLPGLLNIHLLLLSFTSSFRWLLKQLESFSETIPRDTWGRGPVAPPVQTLLGNLTLKSTPENGS